MYLEHVYEYAAQKHLSYQHQSKMKTSTPVLTIIMPHFQDHGTLALEIVGLPRSNTQFCYSTVLNRKMKLEGISRNKLLWLLHTHKSIKLQRYRMTQKKYNIKNIIN